MPNPTNFRLLSEFQKLFEGRPYKHRVSNQGDLIAMHFYEDLITIERSSKLLEAIRAEKVVLNVANRRQGIAARRGDGTLGEIIPGEIALRDKGYATARGRIATIEIGVELKILAKAMIKQIDRVVNDLLHQAREFRKGLGRPLCVAIVGINQADQYVSFEGKRRWPTTGKAGYLHPSQEAKEAERRLSEKAAPEYDEFLILRFKATNQPPYPFEWVDFSEMQRNYGAALVRISNAFQQRHS